MDGRRLILVAACLAAFGAPPFAAAPPQSAPDEVAVLLDRLQGAVQAGDAGAFRALLAPEADAGLDLSFAGAVSAGNPATRVSVRERDRVPMRDTPPESGLRLAVDALIEHGTQARIYSWQIDIVRPDPPPQGGSPGPWKIRRVEPQSFLEGLERLSIDSSAQFRSRHLVVRAEDAEFRLPGGVVYVVQSADGVTGALLLGSGDLVFRPSSAMERGQVRIFSGAETLVARFDSVYLRFAPEDADRLLPAPQLVAEPVDPKLLAKAEALLRDESPRSYVVDLSDFGAGNWWVRPQARDLVAEVRTQKFGTLTYAHAWTDHENVSLFDCRRKRHVSVYASAGKLAERGRFYDDSDGRDYAVRHYDIDAAVAPESHWIGAWARLDLTVQKDGLSRLTFRLAEALKVESISTPEHGRLLGFRAKGHNSLVVTFPQPLMNGQEVSLAVRYSGTLVPQLSTQESVNLPQIQERDEEPSDPMPVEASYLYSHRSYWYPQPVEPDYSTAAMRIRVPGDYACAGSGVLTTGEALTAGVVSSKNPSESQRVYAFAADRPARYLAFVVSRFERMDFGQVSLGPLDTRSPGTGETNAQGGAAASDSDDSLRLAAEVTRRFRSRGQKLMAQAAEMARLYTHIAGGCPYPSLTLALIEHNLPGGHSPAYVTVVNQVLPMMSATRRTWGRDPAAFADFPEYVLAHEVAHQWWGQAVGTKSYHDQWISEGFAQYFAALYAERTYGPLAYRTIVRQFARWARETSDQGPVYLGARLGHIQGDSRIFRALVYNKGALVLHMLRQQLGDEAFFRALARLYAEFRFRKAGTDDVQRVFEAEAGQSLARFFDGWIFGQHLPRLTFSASTEAGADSPVVVIRLSQEEPLFDVPVPVVLDFKDGTSRSIVVPLTGRTAVQVVPIDRPLRRVSVSAPDLAAAVQPG